jgi:hypothetical protein
MNRKIALVVQKKRLHEQGNDFAFWQTQSYEARLAALEEIRNEFSQHEGSGHVQPGFQRVYRIVKR